VQCGAPMSPSEFGALGNGRPPGRAKFQRHGKTAYKTFLDNWRFPSASPAEPPGTHNARWPVRFFWRARCSNRLSLQLLRPVFMGPPAVRGTTFVGG